MVHVTNLTPPGVAATLRGGQRGRGGVAAALSSAARMKSVLVTPKDTWPAYRRGAGLSMECLGVDRDGAQVFR